VPFRSENYLKVLQQHISQKPVPPRQLVADLPEAMEKLILRALAKHPDGRQQTMEELEQDLLEAMPDEASRVLSPRRTPSGGNWLLTPPVGVPVTRPVSEPPVSPTPSLPTPPVNEAAAAAMPEPAASMTLSMSLTSERRRRLLIVAAVAALLVILLVVVGIQHQGGTGGAERNAKTPAPVVIPPAPTPTAPAPAPAPAIASQPETPTATPTPRPAAGADRIPFRVDSTPRGATVSLNGKVLGRTPVSLQVGRARKAGQLTITLKGHEPASQKVDLSRAVDLNIPLEPAAAEKPDAAPTDLELRQNR
jgi:serine/threonine-protein kinase